MHLSESCRYVVSKASAPIDVWPTRIMVDPGWTRYGFTINVLGTCANHTLRLSANRVQLA